MIKLIGTKRAVLLGAVLAANLLVAATYFLVVDPMREEASNALVSVNGQISQLSTQIQGIKTVLAAYKDNHAKYEVLEKSGFFSKQDRFNAGRELDGLRARAGLIGYSYRLDPIKTIPNADADAAKHNLIDTKITLDKISSVIDTNVYALIGDLAASFPMHTRLARFSVKRSKALDAASMKELTRGPTALVEGSVEVDWLTVVPQDAPANATTPGQPGGFRGR